MNVVFLFIVFPCSRGRCFDYEGMGMIEAIAGFINAGKLKLFCVDRFDCLLTSFFAECYVRISRILILEVWFFVRGIFY